MTLSFAYGNRRLVQLTARSWIEHTPGWLADAGAHFDALIDELEWSQEYLPHLRRMQPRLTAVCGRSMDPASRYLRARADRPWTPAAESIRDRVAQVVPGWEPTGLIANWYRTGSDSISWHADNEPALGHDPLVVSVSLGATRRLSFRPAQGGPALQHVDLGDGDLLVMGGSCQSELHHAIVKTVRPVGARIALTFRHYRAT